MRAVTLMLTLATCAWLTACSDATPPARETAATSAPATERAAGAGETAAVAPAAPADVESPAPPAPAAPAPAAVTADAAPASPVAAATSSPGTATPNPAAPVEAAPPGAPPAAGAPAYDVTCPAGAAAAEQCQVDKTTYVGWRTFAAQCQVCHGGSALGSTFAPNLLDRFHAGVDHARFVDVVTNGFRGQVGAMPAWKGNPNVMPHVDAMYAYLKARADGALPPGRPARKP